LLFLGSYLPVLLEGDDGIANSNDWARGFMCGVRLRPERWSELIDNHSYDGPLLPITLLAHENDPDPVMRPKPVVAENRADLLQRIVTGVNSIYRYFKTNIQSIGLSLANPMGQEGEKMGATGSVHAAAADCTRTAVLPACRHSIDFQQTRRECAVIPVTAKLSSASSCPLDRVRRSRSQDDGSTMGKSLLLQGLCEGGKYANAKSSSVIGRLRDIRTRSWERIFCATTRRRMRYPNAALPPTKTRRANGH
jgi:hypothetical protein